MDYNSSVDYFSQDMIKSHNSSVDYFGAAQTGLFGSWLVIIIIASIIGNLMVIIVILRNRRMREARNGTNLFLFNLAISDLMVGVCMAPVSLNTLIHEEWQFPQLFCSINSFLNTLFLLSSVHTLMCISIHKYLSLKRHASGNPHPISRQMCLLMIAISWLWGVIFGITTISGLSEAVYRPEKLQCGPTYPHFIPKEVILFSGNFLLNIVTPLVIMIVAYRKIFNILHQSDVFRAHAAVGCFNDRRLEKGATKTLMLVLTIFVLCWFPYVVYIHYALVIEDKNSIPPYLNALVSYIWYYIILYKLHQKSKSQLGRFKCLVHTTRYSSNLHYVHSESKYQSMPM